jgi:diguanylate cyclase (GGDEF)-like protein
MGSIAADSSTSFDAAGSSFRAASANGIDPATLLAGQQRLLELVARGATVHETLSAIARFGEETLPEMMASVLLFDPETQSLRKGGYGRNLRPEFQDAIDGMLPGPQAGSCGTAAFRSKRVISPDVTTDPLWEPFRPFAAAHGIASAWSTPLLDGAGRLLGVFGMYYGDCREPSLDDLTLVDHVAHLAAIAIERDRNELERSSRASTDFLTGFGNRRRLSDLGERIAADALARDKEHTLALFDIDHFRLHNDLVGQQAADELIRESAKRIAEALAGHGTVVRYGGDQFAALLARPMAEARELATTVLQAIRQPDGELASTLTFSAGLARWVPSASTVEVAAAQALEAVDVAKRLGRDRCVVHGERATSGAGQRGVVARMLKQALDEDALEAHFQPIVRLDDSGLKGFELLARLRGAARSELMPAIFIPVAEQSNLIDIIGTRVLRIAFRTLAEQAALFSGMTLSVNVSFRQLLRDGMAEETTAMAAAFGVSPEQVVLEVTESEWLDGDTPAPDVLIALKRAGFGLALDDFGTRHAALSHLQTIPFDHVKIDRSFTMQLDETPRGRALCEAVVAMSSAFGMKVTAEGVETESQAAALRAMGCQHGQGYLWGRPASLAETVKLLEGVRPV